MKTISLRRACELLHESAAIIAGDMLTRVRVHPDQLTGEPLNEFLDLTWEDDEGYEFSASFLEGDNQEATVEGSTLHLTDASGDSFAITLLAEMNTHAEGIPCDGLLCNCDADLQSRILRSKKTHTGDHRKGYVIGCGNSHCADWTPICDSPEAAWSAFREDGYHLFLNSKDKEVEPQE